MSLPKNNPSVKHSTGQEFPQFIDSVLMRSSLMVFGSGVLRTRVSRRLRRRLTEAVYGDANN